MLTENLLINFLLLIIISSPSATFSIIILRLILCTTSPITAGMPGRPILLRPRASAPLPATLRQRPLAHNQYGLLTLLSKFSATVT